MKNKQILKILKSAELVHVQEATEFYEDGNLIFPSTTQQMLWVLAGYPDNVKKITENFETVIDDFKGYTQKEIQSKCDENIKNGLYNFLPVMDHRSNIELRFSDSGNFIK